MPITQLILALRALFFVATADAFELSLGNLSRVVSVLESEERSENERYEEKRGGERQNKQTW
jgi:hypothetical protein